MNSKLSIATICRRELCLLIIALAALSLISGCAAPGGALTGNLQASTFADDKRVEEYRKDYLGTSGAPLQTAMQPNGQFRVDIRQGESWATLGELPYDQFVREQRLDLARRIPAGKAVTIRLTKIGGGAAHLDMVSLGGHSPLKTAVISNETVKKLERTDFDLADAASPVELTFSPVGTDAILRVAGRIETEVIGTSPFMVPRQNYCRNLDSTEAAYLPYRLDENPVGAPPEITGLEQEAPFIREFLRSGSGHPSEYLTGWVKNDQKNLYVTLDFAGDNTMDGDKDFAKVFARTGDHVREFKVTESDSTWGKARFEYTAAAVWQHKLYEFSIPLTELGASDRSKPLQLAFSTYGTCSAGDLSKNGPELAYSSTSKRYLSVYKVRPDEEYGNCKTRIVGQMRNSDGSQFGAEFTIADGIGTSVEYIGIAVAYDSVNDRFLVVWNNASYMGDLVGQLINPDGTLNGSAQIITYSHTVDYPAVVGLAFDSINARFMVVWRDSRNITTTGADIYGQMVYDDLTPFYPDDISTNFAITNAPGLQQKPKVSFEPVSGHYLVVWQDSETPFSQINGQMVNAADGTLDSSGFIISSGESSQINPDITTDTVNNSFLVSWQDSLNDVYAPKASIVTSVRDVFPPVEINPTGGFDASPRLAFSPADQQFLATWKATTPTLAQRISATDGTPVADSEIIILASTGNAPAVAYNSTCNNFLVASEDNTPNPTTIYYVQVGTSSCADTTPPTDGVLTAFYVGSNQIDLTWTAATDTGSGLAVSNAYKLVRTAGADAPADCSGAAIYQGNGTYLSDTTALANIQYSYRLCAYDAVGLVSVGATSSATTQTFTLTVNSSGSGGAGGTASPSSGTFNAGAYIFISAYPDSVSVFDHWSGDCSGTSPYFSTYISGNMNCTANFAPLPPPQVTGTSPDTGEVIEDVTDASITVYFNVALNPDTIDANFMVVKDQGGDVVAGTVSYDGYSNQLTFTPASLLSAGATYTATVTAAVQNLAGTQMAADYSWSFKINPYLGGVPGEGNLLVTPMDDGRIGVYRYISGSWQEQVYSWDSKGSRLQVGETGTTLGYFGNGTTPTLIGNSQLSSTRTKSEWTTGSGLRIIQELTYQPGSVYYGLNWKIANESTVGISDIRFFHGEDTYFNGSDTGAGFWDAPNNTIGVQRTIATDLRRMSLQAITAPYGYESEHYSTVRNKVISGALSDAIDPSESTDNGYALEWRIATLSAGASWSISAFEKFADVPVGTVAVTAPVTITCNAGASCSLTFTVTNPTISPASVTLTPTPDQAGWTATTAPTSISVAAGGSRQVVVQLSIPAGVTDGFIGHLTLAADDGSVTASDTAAIHVQAIAISPVITWATPADISYGTLLSATQLNATANVPGTFAYTPISGTVLDVRAGQTLSVTFTPNDTTNYFVKTATVAINVIAAGQTISFGSAPSLAFGGASGTVKASATSGLPVTFSSLTTGVCTSTGNTVTPVSAGTCTIAANQAGNSNYTAAAQVTQNITVAVAGQTPIDTVAPDVTDLTIPATSSTLAVPVTTFTASDSVGVSSYLLTENASPPLVTNPSWTATAPLSYTFTIWGNHTLYAYAKDAAGNISLPLSVSVLIAVKNGVDGVIVPAPAGSPPKIEPQLPDALKSLNFAMKVETPTPTEVLHGDVAPLVNGVPQPDGVINLGDTIVILRRVVGL